MLPQQARYCLLVLDLVRAEDGPAEALPDLGLQGIDEGSCRCLVGRFRGQTHMNLTQLHLRQQTNRRVGALFDQIIQGLVDVALRQPQAFERA